MDAEDDRRKAKQFSDFARHVNRPGDKADLLRIAAHWTKRAEEAEQKNLVVQQQHKRRLRANQKWKTPHFTEVAS